MGLLDDRTEGWPMTEGTRMFIFIDLGTCVGKVIHLHLKSTFYIYQ